MIVYLDTSAIVPILIAEASSDICREIWEGASRRASLRLTYIETAAALSMAERRQRITPEEHDRAWANFLAIWPDVDVIDLTKELADIAAGLDRQPSEPFRSLALGALDDRIGWPNHRQSRTAWS